MKPIGTSAHRIEFLASWILCDRVPSLDKLENFLPRISANQVHNSRKFALIRGKKIVFSEYAKKARKQSVARSGTCVRLAS